MTLYKLDNEEFFILFAHGLLSSQYYPAENSIYSIDAAALAENAVCAYRADVPNDKNQTFHMLLQLDDGNILLAAGYDGRLPHIRWLFHLSLLAG